MYDSIVQTEDGYGEVRLDYTIFADEDTKPTKDNSKARKKETISNAINKLFSPNKKFKPNGNSFL